MHPATAAARFSAVRVRVIDRGQAEWDLDPDGEKLRIFQSKLNVEVIGISSATGYNIDSTKERMWQMAQNARLPLETMD